MSLVSSRWHLLCKVCSPSLVRAKLEIPPEHIWSIQCFTTGKTGFQTSFSEETGRDQINCCFATAYTETSHSFQLVLILLIVYDHLAFPHHFCCQNPGNSTQAPRQHSEHISSYLFKVLQVHLGNNTCCLKTSHDFLLSFTQSSTWSNWVGWALQWQTCKMATPLTGAHQQQHGRIIPSFTIWQESFSTGGFLPCFSDFQ